MDIFEWVEDIEKVYNDLIDKEKNESISEIQTLSEKKNFHLKDTLEKKKNFITSVLEDLKKEIKENIITFETEIENALNKIEKNFKIKKEKLSQIIIEKLGFKFNV